MVGKYVKAMVDPVAFMVKQRSDEREFLTPVIKHPGDPDKNRDPCHSPALKQYF